MFAFPNMFHFLAHELARLRGRSFAFTFIFARPFGCFFFWHNKIISPPTPHLDVTKIVADGMTTPLGAEPSIRA
jgi:hypothetical protein